MPAKSPVHLVGLLQTSFALAAACAREHAARGGQPLLAGTAVHILKSAGVKPSGDGAVALTFMALAHGAKVGRCPKHQDAEREVASYECKLMDTTTGICGEILGGTFPARPRGIWNSGQSLRPTAQRSPGACRHVHCLTTSTPHAMEAGC